MPMNPVRETRSTDAQRPAATPRKTWKRPDFTEVSACAEICAYVHRA